jgi:gamma-glutamyltranspeptidase/glutathione hydrolase
MTIGQNACFFSACAALQHVFCDVETGAALIPLGAPHRGRQNEVMSRDFSFPGRSCVFAEKAMVATSSPQASLAALDVLRAGGNAIDAAVTASAVLCITEPHMTGIGGDCFALLTTPDGKVLGLNGAGRSAAAATPDWLAGSGLTAIDPHSAHAVTVPGAIDAWHELLRAHGTRSLGDCLAPAIALAEKGVATMPRVARDWPEHVEMLSLDPGGRQHYLHNGTAPRLGDVMAYPALAETLKRIAKGGRDAFYSGAIAEDMVATLQQRGSLLTCEDFAATHCDWVKPVATSFAGPKIYEIPPSGQGLTVLIALNILDCFGLKQLDPLGPQRRHLEIEALKRAWVLRNRHIADPEHASVPVEELLSAATARRLAATIDQRRASNMKVTLPPSDTVYLSVVDEKRRCVSFINSIYWGFGSGIVTEKTGITLQNRGAGFSCDPSHPNVIAPSKRPLHTIIPAMATRNGKADMVFGVMGGDFQPMGHINMVMNRYVYGMDPQTALDLPRCVPSGETVEAEASMPTSLVNDLKAMGHVMVPSVEPLGGGQIIALDHRRGLLIGGSDPRKDGCALGY